MKLFLSLILVSLLLSLSVSAQEVIVDGFPYGVGLSVDNDFFKPYHNDLKALVDTLNKYPLTKAIITGRADGKPYADENDAKNPALALGRAHTLRNYLVQNFEIDTTRLFIQSSDVYDEGKPFRYASIRIAWDLEYLNSKIEEVAARPPVEKVVEQPMQDIVNNTYNLEEQFKLQLGGGFTTAPFGGIPIVNGAVGWKDKYFVEVFLGHTLWNTSYTFVTEDLRTKSRTWGVMCIYYPKDSLALGIVAGWNRVEQMSTKYQEYVRMSEGPMIGLRYLPFDYLAVTGVYNPHKVRWGELAESDANNDQFRLSITLFTTLGGGDSE